jgi:hypothetical protein
LTTTVKRELLRVRKKFGLARLDAFVSANPGRYLPLSDAALRLAAELWAKCRQEGQPTADAKALDIDVLIAAQILSSEADTSDVVIATTNPKHLSIRRCQTLAEDSCLRSQSSAVIASLPSSSLPSGIRQQPGPFKTCQSISHVGRQLLRLTLGVMQSNLTDRDWLWVAH